MPNGIKYSTGATEAGCLRKGNMLISNNTADTGNAFYTGINPPSGGYTIYLNKASGGPSIYCPANDTQLISITNQIAGASYTTAAQCLDYFASQTDKIVVNFNYEGIVTSGLVLNVDAGFRPSYSSTGTTWYDISGNAYNGTLTNSPTFNSANSGSIVFDGTDDVVDFGNNSTLRPTVFTQTSWIYNTRSGGQQGIFGSYYEPRVSGFFISLLDNKPRFVIGTNTGGGIGLYTEISGTTINQNTWCQLTISYDGTTMKIYKNGVLDASSTWTPGIGYDITNNKVVIGGVFVSSGFVIPFKGNISNCLLYNLVLSQAEVTQNYNAQKGRFGL